MKSSVIFCFILAFSSAVATTTHHKNHHETFRSRHHQAPGYHGLTKARSSDNPGQCRLVCDGIVPEPSNKNVTRYPDGSWSYDIQVDANGHINIGYNVSTNFLAIFNPRLNFTWMTNGVFIGVFNITSGALFVIDTSKNIASIFTNVAIGTFNMHLDIMSFFAGQFNLLIRSSLNMATNFAFRVDSFLTSLRERTLDAFFHGHLNVFSALEVNFGIYINGSMKFGGFNVFMAPIIGTGKFGLEIINNIGSSIEYGRQLTIGTVSFIFTGLGRITAQITASLISIVEGSINSIFNFGTGSINALFNAGGSLFNLITGSIKISGGGSIHISTATSKNHGYLLHYGNETANYTLNYNSTYNTLGVYNHNLKFALLADGTLGYYILFNATSGVGIISNSAGIGKVIIDTSTLDNTVNLDIGARFAILANILKSNVDTFSEGMRFNFMLYLDGYFNKTSSNNTNISQDLLDILEANFNELFDYAIDQNGAELFKKFGVSFLFNIIYGENVIGENYAKLMNSIYAQYNGEFTVKLMLKAYANIQSNIKAGNKGFSSYIFSGLVKACLGGGIGINGIFGYLGFGKC